MLSARAYSFRQKSKLAISLSWIGGYTNVITLISCGWVSSHMTGSTTWLGRALVDGGGAVGSSVRAAGFFGFVLISFLLGGLLSAALIEWAERAGKRSKYILPIAIEIVMLSVFAIILARKIGEQIQQSAFVYVAVGFSCAAMGLQNATITRISGAVVRTTHVTGVVTDFAIESVQYVYWFLDQARGRHWRRRGRLLRVSQRHPGMLRLTVLAAIFGSFLFGAVAGALMFHYWAAMSMALPIAGLCLLILLDAYRPISDVRQLDLLSDPELGMHGIIHSLLPPNLGIYRMATHQHGRLHAPNFQRWAQRLRPQWKVIILALNRQLRFDGNAITDLQAAIALLTESGRKLILCGISTNQFKTLDRHGVTELLGVENICVDLEFAIARGIDLAAGIADLPIGSF